MRQLRTETRFDWQRDDLAPVEPLGDLLRRCRAAASVTLDRERFTAQDRDDCAAWVAERTLRDWHRPARCYCGGRADWRAPIVDDYGTVCLVPRCTPHRGADWRPILRAGSADDVPMHRSPTFLRLRSRADDWRDAELRRRAAEQRERDDAGRREALAGGPVREAIVSDPTAGTPWGARRRALALLRAIGEWRPGEPAPSGALWALAYGAARGADGVESPAVAAELEVSTDTLGKYVRRAAATLAAGHVGVPVPLRWPGKPPFDANGNRQTAERVGAHGPRRHAARALCADDHTAPMRSAGLALPHGTLRTRVGNALPADAAPVSTGAMHGPLPAGVFPLAPPLWAREREAAHRRRAAAHRRTT